MSHPPEAISTYGWQIPVEVDETVPRIELIKSPLGMVMFLNDKPYRVIPEDKAAKAWRDSFRHFGGGLTTLPGFSNYDRLLAKVRAAIEELGPDGRR